MRLTLRTMLAYIDNVLDPADADAIGHKIESSDFSRDLVHRIRTVLKKVRMDAPKLDSKRFDDDPNTVSDYLDSALPQDRIGEFERACIDSDRHLAEVASCHQVLTMVLGKPADVPEALREKIYALGSGTGATKIKPPPVPTGTATPASGAPPVLVGNGQPAVGIEPSEVPEYLRAGRSGNFWPLVASALAILLVASLGLWAAGVFNRDKQQLANAEPSTPTVPTRPPAPPIEPDSLPAKPVEPEPEPGPIERPAVLPSVPIEPTETPIEKPAAPVEPMPVPAPMPMPAESLTPVDVPATVTPPVKPAIAAAPAVEGAKDVGLFVSDDQVLGRWVETDGDWVRVPPRDVLSVGDRLMSLPTFRPQLGLASVVQVTLVGESLVKIEPAGEAEAPALAVDYGKLIVVTGGAAGSQLELIVGDIRGVATLVDADSALAVQVKRFLPPGSDPETTPALPVLELFNTNGRVTWEEAGKPRVEIPAHHLYAHVGAEPPEPQGPYADPEWLESKSIATIDYQTSPILEQLLEPKKPLNLSLLERMQDRRVNVRALSARCMGYLDQFESLLKELNDPKQSAFWNGEYLALRHAIGRSPESALTLKAALQRQRPDSAADLYRLLRGYSPEQLEKGGAAELVKYLEHPEMDVRVLAFQNLYTITGAMEFYMPQKQPQDQKAAIQGWKGRLEKGTITYKTPPSALDTYKPQGRPLGAVEASRGGGR